MPLPAQGPRVIAHDYQMPSTWQSIVGFQGQLGPQLGIEADFTHWKGYNFARQRDPNLFFNPATGYNRNPAQGRPDPAYGQIQWLESNGSADYAAISSGITRRYANNWQAAMSYTYMLFANDDTTNFQYQGNNPFDPDAEWARSTEFQRHTLRFNGIWRLPYDMSVSGAYLFGSGNYYATTVALNPYGHTGTTRLNSGTTAIAVPESVVTSRDQQRHRLGARSLRRPGVDCAPARSRRATPCRGCRCTASTCGCRRTSTCRAARS